MSRHCLPAPAELDRRRERNVAVTQRDPRAEATS